MTALILALALSAHRALPAAPGGAAGALPTAGRAGGARPGPRRARGGTASPRAALEAATRPTRGRARGRPRPATPPLVSALPAASALAPWPPSPCSSRAAAVVVGSPRRGRRDRQPRPSGSSSSPGWARPPLLRSSESGITLLSTQPPPRRRSPAFRRAPAPAPSRRRAGRARTGHARRGVGCRRPESRPRQRREPLGEAAPAVARPSRRSRRCCRRPRRTWSSGEALPWTRREVA